MGRSGGRAGYHASQDSVMYNVAVVSLRVVTWAWRRVPGGVLFVTRRDTCVRACRQDSQLSVINRQLQTCLSLSVLARVLFSRLAGGYSR